MIPKRARRLLNALRLAPRSALADMRLAKLLSEEDKTDVERLLHVLGNPPSSSGEKRLVLLSYLPSPYVLKLEALMARALQARGWKVFVVANKVTEELARAYHGSVLGADVYRLEDYVRFENSALRRRLVDEALSLARSDIAAFKRWAYRGAPLALHAMATLSAARPDGIVLMDKRTRRQLGRLIRRSMLLLDAAGSLYAEIRPSLVLGVEKGFVGTSETFHAALEQGIDYVQWVGCHEPEAIMLKRYGIETARHHPFSISDSNWERLRCMPWRESYRDDVMAEFDRGYKTGAWFRYKSIGDAKTFQDREALQGRLGLDAAKKNAVIYSHILNDANLFYGNDLFAGGYEEWLVETVRAAAENPSVNWILKIHPANVMRNARVGYSGQYGEILALQRAFGNVPEFLHVVRPDDNVSPLSFFELTDWGITVRGTVGLELPCFGTPVLTAGTGRYSGKGFTVDSASTAEYLDRIRAIHRVPPLGPDEVRRGVLYAYHVFKARPARYGELLSDTYRMPATHPRHRNVELRLSSAREILEHPQLGAIARFLESRGEEDFLDSASLERRNA